MEGSFSSEYSRRIKNNSNRTYGENMSEKLALVVDDSKMARVVLSKMLNEQKIDVDQVESGEEALGYLCNHLPDMIFMDHTMPGMDGFQTLRAIRNDPKHAHIPIMMYTSKEGEVFVSQARALGAAAIIPKKKLRAEQLVSVLEGQNLLPNQQVRDAKTNKDESRLARSKTQDEKIVDLLEDDLQEVTKAVEKSIRHRTSSGSPMGRMLTELREQLSQDRHRELDEMAMRLEEKLLHIDARMDQMQSEQLAQTQEQSHFPRWMSLLTLGLLVTCLWLATALWSKNTQVKIKENQTSQLEETITRKEASAENSSSQLEQEIKNLSYKHQKSMGQLYNLVGSVLSQHARFAFNEAPFNDGLAGQLEEVANQLDTLGFRGVITLRSHLGKFCVKSRGNGQATLPREATPASACEVSDVSASAAEERGLAQSMAFSNMISSIEARFGNHIQIALETAGTDEPLRPYPDALEGVSAGDWNKIASQNQRIEFSISPR